MNKIILIYFTSYFCILLIGFIVGKVSNIKVSILRDLIVKLYDPFTIKLKGLLHVDFKDDIQKKRKFKIFFTIFFNNLLFGCLITRTIYGLIFFYPYILVAFGAFSQGIVISRIKIFNPLLLIEFISYVLAASVGTNLGINLLILLFRGNSLPLIISIQPMISVYFIIIAMLLIHTAIETNILTKYDFPKGMNIDMDKSKEYLRNVLDKNNC